MVNRLRKEIVSACLQTFKLGIPVALACHEDYPNMPGVEIILDCFTNFNSVHPRHNKIKEYNVGFDSPHLFKTFSPIRGGLIRMSLVRHEHGQQGKIRRIIIYYQYPGFFCLLNG